MIHTLCPLALLTLLATSPQGEDAILKALQVRYARLLWYEDFGAVTTYITYPSAHKKAATVLRCWFSTRYDRHKDQMLFSATFPRSPKSPATATQLLQAHDKCSMLFSDYKPPTATLSLARALAGCAPASHGASRLVPALIFRTTLQPSVDSGHLHVLDLGDPEITCPPSEACKQVWVSDSSLVTRYTTIQPPARPGDPQIRRDIEYLLITAIDVKPKQGSPPRTLKIP